ncbi:hypothetical protein FRB99_002655 [Tulasnella sp. 403]|nr:hypothetical protein FRB99_002655 [Tulasnella sp. 403]
MANNAEDASDTTAMPGPPPSEVPNGVYILMNKRTKTCLNLDGGGKQNGNKIEGWSRFETFCPNSLWFIERHPSRGYSIRNARAGTAMDANDGSGKPSVLGFSFNLVDPDQCWDLIEQSNGYYSIQNIETKKCLRLKDGSSDNGAEVQCTDDSGDGDDNRLWLLDRRSRSPDEIRDVLQTNPILSNMFEQSHEDTTRYIILPTRLREELYLKSGLDKCIRRPGIFDFEHFVIKSKEVVMSWARDNIALDNCGVLFGIVYGSCRSGRYSYNWTLTADCQSVVFFDAYTGNELTTTSLEQLGFKARFATF